MSKSATNPTNSRALLRQHAEMLRAQAARVDTLIALTRRRSFEFDYQIAYDTALARLQRMSKAELINNLLTDTEVVARFVLDRLSGDKIKLPTNPEEKPYHD